MVGSSPALRRVRRVAIALLALTFVIGAIAAWRYGLTTATMRAWLDSLGPAGPILFVIAFGMGSLVGVPGMAFVVAGRLAFGEALGLGLGYAGGVLACLTPFTAARLLGGGHDTVWSPRNAWLQRLIAMVDRHPIRALAALRVFFWFNAPLSYTLALTRIPWRGYALGCAIGIVPCVCLGVFATGLFV